MKHPNGDAYTTSDYARLAIHIIVPIHCALHCSV